MSLFTREEEELLKRLVSKKVARWWLVLVDKLRDVDTQMGLEKSKAVCSLWYRLTGQNHWTRFGPSVLERVDFTSQLSRNNINCIGKRLAVHLPSHQPLISPENIMVQLQSKSFKTMKREMNETEGNSSLKNLSLGRYLAVLTAEGWERAQILEIRPRKALVRLVDTGAEEEVEYDKMKELAGTALLLPPMLCYVALYGLKTPQIWGELQRAALGEVLHMTGKSISSIDIVVHEVSSLGGRWMVSVLDVVANNHQVNITALCQRGSPFVSILVPKGPHFSLF